MNHFQVEENLTLIDVKSIEIDIGSSEVLFLFINQ